MNRSRRSQLLIYLTLCICLLWTSGVSASAAPTRTPSPAPVTAPTQATPQSPTPTVTATPKRTAIPATTTPTRQLSADELDQRENLAYAELLFDEINRIRAKFDRDPLVLDPALVSVATDQVAFFARKNQLSERTEDNRPLRSLAQKYQYAGGASFSVRQQSAMVWRTTPVDYVVEEIWFATVSERAKLLSADFLHAGIATIIVNNRRFIALVTGKLDSGALTYTPLPTIDNATPIPPDDPSYESEVLSAEKIIVTSTPAADGSVAHVVEKGQTLSEIAYAYNFGWNGIALLNNLDLENPVIYEGDTLLIRPRFTDTITPTITNTPVPPTRTPRPTFTADSGLLSWKLTGTPVPEPGGYVDAFFKKTNGYQKPFSMLLIGVSAVGLLLSLFLRKK